MKVVTLSDAKRLGLKRYFTGIACPHGHVAERRVRDKICLECRKIDRRKYKKTPNGRKIDLRHSTKHNKNKKNSHKLRAIRKVMWAIKSGKLKRMPCEVCGSDYRIHGHHDDYSKPLDVMWLCTLHHFERHEELKKKGIVP